MVIVHGVVEFVGVIFVLLGGGLGILLMLLVMLMLISAILERLRALKTVFKRNRVVRKIYREIKRRWLGLQKNESLLKYPNHALSTSESFFDQIGVYRRDIPKSS